MAIAATRPAASGVASTSTVNTTFGVDVARYQGSINWPAVAGAGIRFATVKASEGPESETSAATRDYFRANLPVARAAGLTVGAYHVVRSGPVAPQVDWYLRQIATVGDYRQMILQIDYEPFSYDFPPYATLKAFLAELRSRVGTHPIVLYTGKWVFDRIADRPANAAADLGVALWDSHYGDNPTNHFESIYPGDSSPRWRTWGGWAAPMILQYGSRARVPGIAGDVDVNAFRGTRDQFVAHLVPAAVPAPAAAPTPAPTGTPAPTAPTAPTASPEAVTPSGPGSPSVITPPGTPPAELPDPGPPPDNSRRGEGPATAPRTRSGTATSPGRG